PKSSRAMSYSDLNESRPLTRNVRVVPVLVDGARTPKADRLPELSKAARASQHGGGAEHTLRPRKEKPRGSPGLKQSPIGASRIDQFLRLAFGRFFRTKLARLCGMLIAQ